MGTANVVPDSTVTVWIDGQGQLTQPPLSHADVLSRAIGAGVAAAVAFALLLAAILRAESLARDKRRVARWEAEWSAVGPQWTRRR